MSPLINRCTATQLRTLRGAIAPRLCSSSILHADAQRQSADQTTDRSVQGDEARKEHRFAVGENISRKEKTAFLYKTLLELDDSKESVYGALDTFVAWEQRFPIASLKDVLNFLQKEQQWHRIVQVIKWMLSKGQGNTFITYQQLIKALDMDYRAKEAHMFWVKKIGHDFHSVPWQLCGLMISVYYHNNMFDDLVKLFKNLEAFGRICPVKQIVQKVANAYEFLGMTEEKERVLEKYSNLLSQTRKELEKKNKKKPRKDKQLDDKSSQNA